MLLREHCSRLQETVGSVYSPGELRRAAKAGRGITSTSSEFPGSASKTAAARRDGWDADGEEVSESESGGNPAPNGEATDSDDAVKIKDLARAVSEGRGRVAALEEQLQTQERLEAIKSLAEWFEKRTQGVKRDADELDRLEAEPDAEAQHLLDEGMDSLSMLKASCLESYRKVQRFYEHFMAETKGGMEEIESQRQVMQQEYEKEGLDNTDESALQQAKDELQKLQARMSEMNDPLRALEATQEQQLLDDLRQEISSRSAKLGEMQALTAEHGARTVRLQKILQTVTGVNPGTLESLDPSLQELANEVKANVLRAGPDYNSPWRQALSVAKAKAEEELGRTTALERQLEELEAEIDSRTSLARVEQAAANRLSMASVDEAGIPSPSSTPKAASKGLAEAGEEEEMPPVVVKAHLMKVMDRLQKHKRELPAAQAEAEAAEVHAEAMEGGKRQVQMQISSALEGLFREDEAGVVTASRTRRPAPWAPSAWLANLERSWKLVEKSPEVYTHCSLRLAGPRETPPAPAAEAPAAPGGSGAEGCGDKPLAPDNGTPWSRAAGAGAAEDASAGARVRHNSPSSMAKLQAGNKALWARLQNLEELLCMDEPSEARMDQWDAEVLAEAADRACREQFQRSLASEEIRDGGPLRQLADESLRAAEDCCQLVEELVAAKEAPTSSSSPGALMPSA